MFCLWLSQMSYPQEVVCLSLRAQPYKTIVSWSERADTLLNDFICWYWFFSVTCELLDPSLSIFARLYDCFPIIFIYTKPYRHGVMTVDKNEFHPYWLINRSQTFFLNFVIKLFKFNFIEIYIIDVILN